jgi:hypothetical protein
VSRLSGALRYAEYQIVEFFINCNNNTTSTKFILSELFALCFSVGHLDVVDIVDVVDV